MPLTIRSISYRTRQSDSIRRGATSEAERGTGGVMCSWKLDSDRWRLEWSWRTEQTERLKSWNLIFSVALRVEHAQCWCLSSLPLWDATAVLPSRLGTGLLMDISLMERYSGQAAAAQWIPLSVFLCFALCFSVSLFIAPLSYLSFISASLTLPPIIFLTHYLPLSRLHPFLFLSPCLSSSLRPSTSLSHTLVATLKTVVTMVTAMCCGNVKELNTPKITSLFNT